MSWMWKKKYGGEKMSEIEVDLQVWNALSLEAQLAMLKKHKSIVKNTYFTKDGRPRCATCGRGMKPAIDSRTGKLSKYEWELDCECIKKYPKLKNLRLCIG